LRAPGWTFASPSVVLLVRFMLRREGLVWSFVTQDFRGMHDLGLFHFHCLSKVPRWSMSQ
jgi:hypothetical protein